MLKFFEHVYQNVKKTKFISKNNNKEQKKLFHNSSIVLH